MKERDLILAIVLMLVAFGIIMIYSSSALAGERFKGEVDAYFFLRRQLLWALLSFLALILVMDFDYHRLGRAVPWLLAGCAVLLVGVLFSREINGARRWIRFWGIGFQPSEIAKMVLILFVAHWMATRREILGSFKKGFLPLVGGCGILIGLVAIEPDIGTATFLSALALTLMLLGGARLAHFLPFLVLVVPPAAYFLWHRFAHIEQRVRVFLDPTADPLGKGLQVLQSLIAIGSGGPLGLGLGQGRQKLFYLPEESTDYILSIVGEELGLVGTLGVLVLFALLLWLGFRVAWKAPDALGFYLAIGISTSLVAQALLNVAVVTATVPPKGISLPFISAGGSGLFFSLIGMGILLNIAAAGDRAREAAGTQGREAPYG